jgi:hypothetical protein
MTHYAEYYETFLEAEKQCTKKLLYIPPEALVSLDGTRSPVVIVAKMAQKACEVAPEADQQRLVAKLADLAELAAKTPSHMLLSHWWTPMCNQHLPNLLGANDMPWKQELIHIWTNEHLKEKSIPEPEPF